MIEVGIHDNISITKAEIDEKGALNITFKKGSAAGNVIDLLNSGTQDTMSEGNTQLIKLFGFNEKTYDGAIDPDYNIRQIQELRDPLTHILSNFLKEDDIRWDAFKGVSITLDNLKSEIVKPSVLATVFKNICDQFIAYITPFITDSQQPSRMLFVRQSPSKGFPALRKRYVQGSPFMEPMTVPKEQSALKFTPWEISKGYNVGGQAVTPDAIPAEESQDAGNLID